MSVIKRSSKSTNSDLIAAIEQFIELLKDQDEAEAVELLSSTAIVLAKQPPGSEEHKAAVLSIIDAFDGDLELAAYTIQRNSNEWTEIEELSRISSRVLSLARRLK